MTFWQKTLKAVTLVAELAVYQMIKSVSAFIFELSGRPHTWPKAITSESEATCGVRIAFSKSQRGLSDCQWLGFKDIK